MLEDCVIYLALVPSVGFTNFNWPEPFLGSDTAGCFFLLCAFICWLKLHKFLVFRVITGYFTTPW